MGLPVEDPAFWKERLEKSKKTKLHYSVYICNPIMWSEAEEKHRRILKEKVGPTTSVLDVGCGYGRLIDLMPEDWRGAYMGLDVSPDFLQIARANHPNHTFILTNVMDFNPIAKYDIGVLVSVRPMIKRNCGEEYWNQMEAKLMTLANELIYLEIGGD